MARLQKKAGGCHHRFSQVTGSIHDVSPHRRSFDEIRCACNRFCGRLIVIVTRLELTGPRASDKVHQSSAHDQQKHSATSRGWTPERALKSACAIAIDPGVIAL
jgi:hypothetical protein